MSTHNDVLESRFFMNMARISGLMKLMFSDIDQLKPSGFSLYEGASADIFRTIVVFLHATFEDVLRTTARQRITSAAEEVLNDIPLVGLERREKFGLGGLGVHRGKAVDQVIDESVQDYLSKKSFSSCADIDKILRQSSLDSKPFKHLYRPINQMMKRRHRIVHDADLAGPTATIADAWTIADTWQLILWLTVVPAFYMRLRMSIDPSNEAYPKAHRKLEKAIAGIIDFGNQLLDVSKASPERDLQEKKKDLQKLSNSLNSLMAIFSDTVSSQTGKATISS